MTTADPNSIFYLAQQIGGILLLIGGAAVGLMLVFGSLEIACEVIAKVSTELAPKRRIR
jgi:hypothetical protein